MGEAEAIGVCVCRGLRKTWHLTCQRKSSSVPSTKCAAGIEAIMCVPQMLLNDLDFSIIQTNKDWPWIKSNIFQKSKTKPFLNQIRWTSGSLVHNQTFFKIESNTEKIKTWDVLFKKFHRTRGNEFTLAKNTHTNTHTQTRHRLKNLFVSPAVWIWPDMIGMRTRAPKSTEGKMVNGRETLRLRSKGAATVQEVVSFTLPAGTCSTFPLTHWDSDTNTHLGVLNRHNSREFPSECFLESV